MGIACCSLLVCFLMGGSPKHVSSKPVLNLRLASAISCKRSGHYPVSARFAPVENRAAIVVSHRKTSESLQDHVITVDANMMDVQALGDVPPIGSRRTTLLTPEQDMIQWSPDGAFVAILGQKSVTLFQIEGGRQCSIALQGASRVAGFSQGPSLVVSSETAEGKHLVLFDTACQRTSSVPVGFSFESAAVSLAGERFAFLSLPTVWRTSLVEEAADPMELDQYAQLAQDAGGPSMGRYTEDGQVLCVATENHAGCYAAASGTPAGTMPKGNPGRMLDASAKGSRVVFPYTSLTALDTAVAIGELAASIAAATHGNGGSLPEPVEQPLGCIVWDYRAGKEVHGWELGPWEQSGFADALKYLGPPESKKELPAVCAITSGGHRLLAVTKTIIQVYELPANEPQQTAKPPS